MQPNTLAQPLFDLWGFQYTTSPVQPASETGLLHADITMLHDEKGLIAAMHPAGYTLNVDTLRKNFNRSSLSPVFIDSLHNMITPLKPDAIELVVDDTLFQANNLCFVLPNKNYGLILEQPSAQFLHHNQSRGNLFSAPPQKEQPETGFIACNETNRLRERIARIEELPAMPETAYYLLKLRNNPDATIGQLVDVIERDPALVAQIMRHANSAWYQSTQPVETTHDAIFRVIGFENAIYICLGSVIGKTFRLADEGPLGKDEQWRQSVFSASLAQQLLSLSDARLDVKPGLLYIAALLHNIGVMVMAQIFRPEYLWLNHTLGISPQSDVFEIEKRQFGITHSELGSLLMLEWCLPLAITTTALECHSVNYKGPYQDYVYLVQAANMLLENQQPVDKLEEYSLPGQLMEKLGLDEEKIHLAVSMLLDNNSALEKTVLELAS